MTPMKILAVLLVIIGLILPALSFTSGTLMPAELSLTQSTFNVDTGSTVVIDYNFYETYSTRDYEIELEGVGNDLFLTSGKVNLAYNQHYYGTFTFTAPSTPGVYTYKTHTYMWANHPTTGVLTKVEFGYDVKTITVTTSTPPPPTYTLTVNAEDENNQRLPGVEVSINTGVIGTTDSFGIVIEPDLIGSYTVTGTKLSYNSDSTTVNMIQDQTVLLTLVYIPPTYNLTIEIEDENADLLSGVEIALNGNVIGISDIYGTITETDLSGTYTITATKAGYNSAVLNVDVTEDQTSELVLTLIATPTPTPDPNATANVTPTPTTTPYVSPPSGGSSSSSSDDDDPVLILYTLNIELLDSEQKPIEDAKIMINGDEYYSDSDGLMSESMSPGEQISVIITKDGYNTFENSYTIDENTALKITLPDSGGEFFFNLDLIDDNPFYDPDGLFGTIPYSIVIISALLISAGIILFIKKE